MTTYPSPRQQILSSAIAECCYTVLALAAGSDCLADLGGISKIPRDELRALALTSLEGLIVLLDEWIDEPLSTAHVERLRAGQKCCGLLVQGIAGWDGVGPFPAEAEQAFDAMYATFRVEPRSTLKDLVADMLSRAGGQPAPGG